MFWVEFLFNSVGMMFFDLRCGLCFLGMLLCYEFCDLFGGLLKVV